VAEEVTEVRTGVRRKRERKGRERSREDCGRGKKGKRRSTRGKIENTVVEALVRVLPQLFPRRAEETSQRVRDSLLVCEVHVTNRESEREEREREEATDEKIEPSRAQRGRL
jgi:hypothetical protein